MGGILGGCLRRKVAYRSRLWSQPLGEPCQRCQKSLSYEKCVSPCRCYLFSHEECFKKSFASQIHDLNTEVRCLSCQAEVRLSLKTEFTYDPQPTCCKLCKLGTAWILLIAVVFLAVATLGSRLQQHYKFFIAYLAIVALSLTLYWLIVCFRAIFYRQEFLITEVGSTKLDIQTSAFQDLEMETNSQLKKEGLHGITI